jgi:hypothetical protein
MSLNDQIVSLWPTVWPALTLLVGFAAKAVIDQLAVYQSGKAIEGIKAEFQTKLEGLRGEIKSRDEAMGALRASVLQRSDARAVALAQRRITAVERLWTAVIELGPFIIASKMTAPLKFEAMLTQSSKQNEQGKKIRDFAEMYWQMLKVDNVKTTISPESERPFLSETAWARFSLFRSVVTYPVTMLAAVRSGIDPDLIKDPKPLLDAMKTAMPHFSSLIDEFGIGTFPELRDQLQDLVLKEVLNIIEGESLDKNHLEEAAKIIAATNAYNEANHRQQAPNLPAMNS